MEIDLYPGVAMWTCWYHNAPLYGPLYGETRCSHTGCQLRLNRFEYQQIRFNAHTRKAVWFLTDTGYLLQNHGVPDYGSLPPIDKPRVQPTPWHHVYMYEVYSVSSYWIRNDAFNDVAFSGTCQTEVTTLVLESLRLPTGVHKPLADWQPVKDDIVLYGERVFSYVATMPSPPSPFERAALEAEFLTKSRKG